MAVSKQVRSQVRQDRLCQGVQGLEDITLKAALWVFLLLSLRLLLVVCLSVIRDEAFCVVLNPSGSDYKGSVNRS